ncbi:MAG: hypothetical protein ABJP90_12555 [Paracoccaceae bacterium]
MIGSTNSRDEAYSWVASPISMLMLIGLALGLAVVFSQPMIYRVLYRMVSGATTYVPEHAASVSLRLSKPLVQHRFVLVGDHSFTSQFSPSITSEMPFGSCIAPNRTRVELHACLIGLQRLEYKGPVLIQLDLLALSHQFDVKHIQARTRLEFKPAQKEPSGIRWLNREQIRKNFFLIEVAIRGLSERLVANSTSPNNINLNIEDEAFLRASQILSGVDGLSKTFFIVTDQLQLGTIKLQSPGEKFYESIDDALSSIDKH